jgi:hypothetical protein
MVFELGDIVRAVVTHGKKTGTHVGRVAVRTSGRFGLSRCPTKQSKGLAGNIVSFLTALKAMPTLIPKGNGTP